MNKYHVPVLAKACIEGLNIKPNGIYVDTTFGGGGHSSLILNELNNEGKLLGFDQDLDAKQNIPNDKRFTFVHANFCEIKKFVRLYGFPKVDGILADLGVSSYQFDTAERGFSYRFDAKLDMRMNTENALNAAEILNSYSEENLVQIFSQYGEIRNSKTLAKAIVHQRTITRFHTISDLLNTLDGLIFGNDYKYYGQVFQALRIEVNKEMEVLETFLKEATDILLPGGRLVILTYHSGEDRMVKNFFKAGNIQGEHQKDFYGNINRPLEIITKKPVEPTPEEIELNSRARSARLRIAEKI